MNKRIFTAIVCTVVLGLLAFMPVRKIELTLTEQVDLTKLSPKQEERLSDNPLSAVVAVKDENGVLDTLFLPQDKIKKKKFPVGASYTESYLGFIRVLNVY